MTRFHLERLQKAKKCMDEFNFVSARFWLESAIADAEREFAAEDAHHDGLEADAIPVNAEAA